MSLRTLLNEFLFALWWDDDVEPSAFFLQTRKPHKRLKLLYWFLKAKENNPRESNWPFFKDIKETRRCLADGSFFFSTWALSSSRVPFVTTIFPFNASVVMLPSLIIHYSFPFLLRARSRFTALWEMRVEGERRNERKKSRLNISREIYPRLLLSFVGVHMCTEKQKSHKLTKSHSRFSYGEGEPSLVM